MDIRWTDEDARHIMTRSERYPGALDLAVAWTVEAVNDKNVVQLSPDPRSSVGASSFIGYSPGAGRVLCVVAVTDLAGNWHGRNAWPASGRDLAAYQEGMTNERAI